MTSTDRDTRAIEDSDSSAYRSPARPYRWWQIWRWLRLVRRGFQLLIVAAVVLVLVAVVGLGAGFIHVKNPFAATTTDRSQPALLVSIQNLARFEAASGNFQVVIDVQHDRAHIPDFLFSERSLFVATGSVAAFVDFSHLGAADVVTSSDRRTVTLTLPAPQLAPAALDPAHSYVYSDQRGLINKLGDLVSSDPNQESQLYQLAQRKIATAAVGSQLTERAKTNTIAMLQGLLKALGFTSITVNFPPVKTG